MGENSKIEWTDHTFNPWIGCTEVSPACDHCYARRQNEHRKWVNGWGAHGERRRTSASNWKKPFTWNREAERTGRKRVFCASLADVFDNQVPQEWRDDLWRLIERTPNLDWMLLTKRPQNIYAMQPASWAHAWPDHVWAGTTAENQVQLELRGPLILAAKAKIHFLSAEPLLGPMDAYGGDADPRLGGVRATRSFLGRWWRAGDPDGMPPQRGFDLVIAGGESGPGARPSHPDWFRSLRDQCEAAEIHFHFKQWGEWSPHEVHPGGDLGGDLRRGFVTTVHPTGQSDVEVFEATGRNTIRGTRYMARIGKVRAGRLLDGRTWDQMPEVAA